MGDARHSLLLPSMDYLQPTEASYSCLCFIKKEAGLYVVCGSGTTVANLIIIKLVL